MMNFIHDDAAKASVPPSLRRLLTRLAKTICMRKNGVTVLQSVYTTPIFSVCYNTVATLESISMPYKIKAHTCTIAIPIYRSAKCYITDLGQQMLASPNFYFVRAIADVNMCEFPAGISSIIFINLPKDLLETLLEKFPHSGILQELLSASTENTAAFISEAHQVTTAQLGQLLVLLIGSSTKELHERENADALVWKIDTCIGQAGDANAPIPNASTSFEMEFQEAEQDYMDESEPDLAADSGKKNLLQALLAGLKQWWRNLRLHLTTY